MKNKVFICLLCFATSYSYSTLSRSPAQQYLHLFDKGLTHSREQMPIISDSAQEAAAKLIAGGTLYAAESQEGFHVEAINRAGGTLCLKWITDDKPSEGDIVLIGIGGKLTADNYTAIQDWKSRGAYIVAFASKALFSDPNALPNALIDNSQTSGLTVQVESEQKLCPVDTVINVVNLWVWTGELTSACTRLGKMPILYQSYFAPGGKERADKYKGKIFHDDMTIEPIAPGLLGNSYLDAISTAISSFRQNDMDKLAVVASWWRSAQVPQKTKLLSFGHMFPAHFQDPRTPQLITMQNGWNNEPLPNTFSSQNFVLVCGYQDAPQKLVEQAVAERFKLAYISVKCTEPAEPSDNIIYLNPHWPLTDGCVAIPGYDIPILPASGVVNAVIYWTLVAQYCDTQI